MFAASWSRAASIDTAAVLRSTVSGPAKPGASVARAKVVAAFIDAKGCSVKAAEGDGGKLHVQLFIRNLTSASCNG